MADEVPRSTAKALWDGFYDLVLHVDSATVMDLHRSTRAELDALQNKLRLATDEAKAILELHAEDLGIARRNLPWSG